MHANNLLEITKNFLAPDIVNKFSRDIGESTERTQKALKSVIPALLMGIVIKGRTADGAECLVNLVHRDGLELKDEKSFQYTDAKYLNKGTDAVQGIFGNNLNTVVANLGDSTGIQSSGIQKMLQMAAPLVMDFLATKMKREELGTPGLMGFLAQQNQVISQLVPDGLVGRWQVVKEIVPNSRSPWLTIIFIVLVILAGLWWLVGMEISLYKNQL